MGDTAIVKHGKMWYAALKTKCFEDIEVNDKKKRKIKSYKIHCGMLDWILEQVKDVCRKIGDIRIK